MRQTGVEKCHLALGQHQDVAHARHMRSTQMLQMPSANQLSEYLGPVLPHYKAPSCGTVNSGVQGQHVFLRQQPRAGVVPSSSKEATVIIACLLQRY